jgi:hypothetical protein
MRKSLFLADRYTEKSRRSSLKIVSIPSRLGN